MTELQTSRTNEIPPLAPSIETPTVEQLATSLRDELFEAGSWEALLAKLRKQPGFTGNHIGTAIEQGIDFGLSTESTKLSKYERELKDIVYTIIGSEGRLTPEFTSTLDALSVAALHAMKYRIEKERVNSALTQLEQLNSLSEAA